MEKLHKAIEQNNIFLVRISLEKNSTILHSKNENGISAFELACKAGNPHIIKLCKEFTKPDINSAECIKLKISESEVDKSFNLNNIKKKQFFFKMIVNQLQNI